MGDEEIGAVATAGARKREGLWAHVDVGQSLECVYTLEWLGRGSIRAYLDFFRCGEIFVEKKGEWLSQQYCFQILLS